MKLLGLGIATAFLCSLAGLSAQELRSTAVAAPHPKVVLVELFTSEGCSSCPPADTLLRQLNGTRTDANQLVVGISEHVTYWNSLGWSDPFSSPVYTERQNAYGERFGLGDVYTPQMVVNGDVQFVGSDKARLLRALHDEQQPSLVDLRIVSTDVAERSLRVSFSANGGIPRGGVDIFAVLADDADRSNVARGENSGRTLTHVAVARSLTRVSKLSAAAEQTVQIPLPASFQTTQPHHLILFAQTPGNGRVLGADTKPL